MLKSAQNEVRPEDTVDDLLRSILEHADRINNLDEEEYPDIEVGREVWQHHERVQGELILAWEKLAYHLGRDHVVRQCGLSPAEWETPPPLVRLLARVTLERAGPGFAASSYTARVHPVGFNATRDTADTAVAEVLRQMEIFVADYAAREGVPQLQAYLVANGVPHSIDGRGALLSLPAPVPGSGDYYCPLEVRTTVPAFSPVGPPVEACTAVEAGTPVEA